MEGAEKMVLVMVSICVEGRYLRLGVEAGLVRRGEQGDGRFDQVGRSMLMSALGSPNRASKEEA